MPEVKELCKRKTSFVGENIRGIKKPRARGNTRVVMTGQWINRIAKDRNHRSVPVQSAKSTATTLEAVVLTRATTF